MKLQVEKILPNPQQPRTVFDEEAMQELAESIRQSGLQSPILVEDNHNGTYTLVAGERRLRAHKLIGLAVIEATVREPTNHQGRQRLIDAMTENVQRDNMNAVDEAHGYIKMHDEFKMSVAQISKSIGVNHARVSNLIKLGRLESPIKDLISQKRFPSSPQAIDALYAIPQGKIRIEFALGAAARSATIKAIVASSARLLKAMQDKTIKGAPAIVIGKRAAKPKQNLPQWDALSHSKKLPPWSLFVTQVEATCASCSLREVASESTCRDCPMVDLVHRLLEQAHVP
jgi:ParB family chromosome partitioning protein